MCPAPPPPFDWSSDLCSSDLPHPPPPPPPVVNAPDINYNSRHAACLAILLHLGNHEVTLSPANIHSLTTSPRVNVNNVCYSPFHHFLIGVCVCVCVAFLVLLPGWARPPLQTVCSWCWRLMGRSRHCGFGVGVFPVSL